MHIVTHLSFELYISDELGMLLRLKKLNLLKWSLIEIIWQKTTSGSFKLIYQPVGNYAICMFHNFCCVSTFKSLWLWSTCFRDKTVLLMNISFFSDTDSCDVLCSNVSHTKKMWSRKLWNGQSILWHISNKFLLFYLVNSLLLSWVSLTSTCGPMPVCRQDNSLLTLSAIMHFSEVNKLVC